MEKDLNFFQKEDDFNNLLNGRPPQLEDDLNWKTTSLFQMQDNLIKIMEPHKIKS
jgi:hypothetical protein